MASILSVGALAWLAGHGWGILIVAAAEVGLLGKVWPIVATGDTDSWSLAAAWAILVTALPGVFLFILTLPRTVELCLGRLRPPLHRLGMTVFAGAAALWLVAPGLFADPQESPQAKQVASPPTAPAEEGGPRAALGIEPERDGD